MLSGVVASIPFAILMIAHNNETLQDTCPHWMLTQGIISLALDAALTQCVCMAADDPMDTVRHMQQDVTCAQALTKASNGLWCQELFNAPGTLATNLDSLKTGDVLPSGLFTEIQSCFEVSQVFCILNSCLCKQLWLACSKLTCTDADRCP